MKYACILVLAILFVTTGAYADVVNKISIESMTNQNVPEDVVRANIVLQEGATFSQRRLSEDIKRLIKTGQFRRRNRGQSRRWRRCRYCLPAQAKKADRPDQFQRQ